MSLAEAGCSRSPSLLSIPTEIEVPAVLVSEIQAADNRMEFGTCSIAIVNPGFSDQNVRLIRTGCSCYGTTFNGEKLENGSSVTIPAGGQREVQLEFQPAESHSEKIYTADFEVISPTGEVQQAATKCRMRVFSDVRMTPSVLAVDVDHNQKGTENTSLIVEHTYRSPSPATFTLALSHLPVNMKMVSAIPQGEAEEVAPGLWKQTWEVTADVNVDDLDAEETVPVPFGVVLQNEEGVLSAQGQGSLLVHVRKSIAFPKRVHFGKLPMGGTRSRRILLSSTEAHPFRLKCNHSLLPPGVTVKVSESVDERHLVELIVCPQTPGPFSETVKLQTDMYDVCEIAVKLEGLAE